MMFNLENCPILYILALYVLSGYSRSQVGTNNIIRCTDDGEKNLIVWWLNKALGYLFQYFLIFRIGLLSNFPLAEWNKNKLLWSAWHGSHFLIDILGETTS